MSEPWLEFARENRAAELTREAVVGQPVWRYVAGRETRQLYQDLYRRVRSREQPIEVPFRCDSPDRFRFMCLRLEPAERGEIRCEGRLLREQERPFFSILDRAFPRTSLRLPMCSLCKRVFAFDMRWLELEDAIRQLDLFDSRNLPEIEHAVCDGCDELRRRHGGAAA